MSRRNPFGWYERTAKRPPPEHGIRMKKAGTTWWGQRWIEALENVLRGDSARLARGRTYARAGRTHDLVVEDGRVTAKVTGSRPMPYSITIELTKLSGPVWKKAIDGMARKAQFSAELLAGQMPKDIDEVFADADSSLFPTQRAALKTKCSCPDWGDPCKHIAATHYVLGEALDRDPFLLFELRGRTKDQVLDALSAARSVASKTKVKTTKAAATKSATTRAAKSGRTTKATAMKGAMKGATAGKASQTKTKRSEKARLTSPLERHEVATVKLGKLNAADYDTPRGALPTLHFGFDELITHGALLRQLGAPSGWEGKVSLTDALAPLVRAAAEKARHIAMAEPNDLGATATPPRRRRTPGERVGKAVPN